MSPFARLPDYPWEKYPDEGDEAWDDDIPVNIYGETDEDTQ